MNASAADLKGLHQLLLEYRTIEDELDRGPKQVKARQQIIQKKTAERDAAKDRLMELRKLSDQKGLQLRSQETKLLDLKNKLNMANSNREYDIIRTQIDADTMAMSVLEDEILETLELVDAAQVEVGRLNEAIQKFENDLKAHSAEFESKVPALKESSDALKKSIKEYERFLPSDVAGMYRRLVIAHGPEALAPVEGGTCKSCNVNLLAQSRVELNSGKIIFCKNCGRLMYLADKE
ncbi:MAG: hypothetical protein O2955_01755 [Planctomycetota bacterium]|nr:hypothetical protein [Planctomycetota bacterium]MDA1211208.1 hypothetical protein [Planctomycetota bacterium]